MKKKDRRHLSLLCDISELAALLIGSENIQSFFQLAVELVARHMNADVCSIYLFDDVSQELVLKATKGLNPEAVGQIRMKIGEGLVGTTFKQLKPLNEEYASSHPNFKYFKEAREDPFHSFLAVPIARREEKIGVLVVQHRTRSFFNEIDVIAMQAVASQLAGAVGNARLLVGRIRLREEQLPFHRIPEHLKYVIGEVASQGYAFAQATTFDKRQGALVSIEIDTDSEYSLEDFHQALQATAAQLQDLQYRFFQRLPESTALIFTAHLMILKDVRFAGEMENLIKSGVPPPEAIKSVMQRYVELYSSSPHPHIKEKTHDVQDLAGRILRNLIHGIEEDPFLSENRIVIARELYPSDVLKLASEDIKGIILVGGGVTTHVSILARSLEIPMIITNRSELLYIPEGTPVVMDAETGAIYVQPSDDIILSYESRKQTGLKAETLYKEVAAKTFTCDGVRIRLLANINLLHDLVLARELKAEGVGLYRTEFPFLFRSALPSEEEQYVIYKKLFDEMSGNVVTIRTLDIGGDKLPFYSNAGVEANPALGLRAIRFLFRHREIFDQQLRAILRAAAEAANPRIMFPMISSLDEFRQAKQAVYDCMQELAQKKMPHHQTPFIGVLVEIPSVLEIIDDLVAESDFLSIGTNDFVQYMLAVDRANEKVSEFYRPDHPAVLRALAKISKAANGQQKELSICGEMAHEPAYIPFLLGIGVQIFSVYPKFLSSVQKIISAFTISDAKMYADQLLAETTLKGVREALTRLSKTHNLNELK
ncbi:MAG: phosphoenolpyruvate--protein phosphotransferase [Desulfobacterales bacterium]|uniref:phosphoenolpyruvate--protein phosphotransferase n=1 Tax=Candidatus Desulfatibia vada TaxID=2841696 RepID=A0A8J6P5U5_9BACT|nr:phosphoenolpyruvate--protein phosphotransferase [Candidatus Desulfatibia vada]